MYTRQKGHNPQAEIRLQGNSNNRKIILDIHTERGLVHEQKDLRNIGRKGLLTIEESRIMV